MHGRDIYNHYTQKVMPKVMLEGYKCERCGHTWIPRSTTMGDPTICPRCKSPYWNKPRRNAPVAEIERIRVAKRSEKA
jgi:predicted Zn-ribbon and HTH transcriptional regulator